jgi:hypothetical protein
VFSLPGGWASASGLSKAVSSCSAPKRAGFDVQIPSVEPSADGTKVDRSHADFVGPELLLGIEIGGAYHQVLVDSGTSVSVMKPGIVASEIRTTETAARGITEARLKIMGTQVIIFKVGKRMFTHEFLIAPLDAEYSGVLGIDVLSRMEASVDLRTSTLVLGRKRYQLSGQEVERC